eukprot:756021-Hanusia_phi.AAC.5
MVIPAVTMKRSLGSEAYKPSEGMRAGSGEAYKALSLRKAAGSSEQVVEGGVDPPEETHPPGDADPGSLRRGQRRKRRGMRGMTRARIGTVILIREALDTVPPVESDKKGKEDKRERRELVTGGGRESEREGGRKGGREGRLAAEEEDANRRRR